MLLHNTAEKSNQKKRRKKQREKKKRKEKERKKKKKKKKKREKKGKKNEKGKRKKGVNKSKNSEQAFWRDVFVAITGSRPHTRTNHLSAFFSQKKRRGKMSLCWELSYCREEPTTWVEKPEQDHQLF